MSYAIVFLVSVFTAYFVCLTQKYHAAYSYDHDTSGIQKMHALPVPRIGGVVIFAGLVSAAIVDGWHFANWSSFNVSIMFPVACVFMIGLGEDLFKSLSPAIRMLVMIIAVAVAVQVLHVMPMIRHLDNIWLDAWLTIEFLGFLLTCFAVVGVANSYNIVDGYHGLSSTSAIFNLLGLYFLAQQLGELSVAVACINLIMATLGFWVFNYPCGRIFLGDGGAYTLGFSIALLSLNLVEHKLGQISPYAVLVLAAYPITETVFTIFRRKLVHKTYAMQPDNLHLHQLIFNRCISASHLTLQQRNARVMPIMLVFVVPQLVYVMIFYRSTVALLIGLAAYVAIYIYIYMRLIHFRIPRFLLAYALLNKKQ